MNASERLDKLIEMTGENRSSLAKIIGVIPQRLHDIANGKTNTISFEVAAKIVLAYPMISEAWLLSGEGEMLNYDFKDIEVTDNQRFKMLLSKLKLMGEIANDADFSRKMGVSRSYVSELKNNKRTLTGAFVEQIYNKFPGISKRWLLTGEGDMLNSGNESSSSAPMPMNEAVPTLPAGWLNVPVVPVTAQAGYMSGYGDPEYIDELDKLPFPVDRHYKGRYMCFEVRGDSMDDASSESILSGDFVLAREIQRHLWQDYKLHFKKWSAFVVVTRSEGVVIKQITDHDVENKTITLHSLNPLFSDYTVSLSDVLEIYNVVQITRKSR